MVGSIFLAIDGVDVGYAMQEILDQAFGSSFAVKNSLIEAVPITMVAWCNLHGGFLAGMGLLTLYAVGMIGDRRGRLLLGMLLTCACATLINPYGFDYWLYLIPAVTMRRPGVAEWAPVPWNVTYFPFWILAILAVAALWQLRDQWRQSLAPMLVIGVTLVLAMRLDRPPLDQSQGQAAAYYGSVLPGVWSFQLAARARGIGSAWTTFHLEHEAEIAELLGIPPSVTQVCLLAVGYVAGGDFTPAPRRPAAEVTYLNRWKQPVR